MLLLSLELLAAAAAFSLVAAESAEDEDEAAVPGSHDDDDHDDDYHQYQRDSTNGGTTRPQHQRQRGRRRNTQRQQQQQQQQQQQRQHHGDGEDPPPRHRRRQPNEAGEGQQHEEDPSSGDALHEEEDPGLRRRRDGGDSPLVAVVDDRILTDTEDYVGDVVFRRRRRQRDDGRDGRDGGDSDGQFEDDDDDDEVAAQLLLLLIYEEEEAGDSGDYSSGGGAANSSTSSSSSSSSCRRETESALLKVEEAARLSRNHWDRQVAKIGNEGGGEGRVHPIPAPPKFAALPVKPNTSTASLLSREYSIESAPALVFVVAQRQRKRRKRKPDGKQPEKDENPNNGGTGGAGEDREEASSASTASTTTTLLLEYTGPSKTPLDVFRTVLHYHVRLVLSTGGMVGGAGEGDSEDEVEDGNEGGSGSGNSNQQQQEKEQEYVQLKPKEYRSLRDVQSFLETHWESLLPYSNVPQDLPALKVWQRRGNGGGTAESGNEEDDLDLDDDVGAPRMTPEQVEHVKWLLQEEEDPGASSNGGRGGEELEDEATSLSLPDDFVVLVQCRSGGTTTTTTTTTSSPGGSSGEHPALLYERFDQLSRTLSNRRDRFFAVARRCGDIVDGGHDGSVVAWRLPLNFFESSRGRGGRGGDGWRHPFDLWSVGSGGGDGGAPPPRAHWRGQDPNRLTEWIVRACTPSVMVLDRQTTAPTAFPAYRKVHAVLIVEARMLMFVTPEEKAQTRQIVRQFRRACRQNQRRSFAASTVDGGEGIVEDMVCLVVPTTETRILMALGVDVWGTTTAASVCEQDGGKEVNGAESCGDETTATPLPEALPMLLVTDQREAGTKRYYLDYEDLLADGSSNNNNMDVFLQRFWEGDLEPELRSDPKGPRTNTAGVRILTADTIQEELFEQYRRHSQCPDVDDSGNAEGVQRHHKMIVFVSPTCGHCKRFLVLWNRLSEFLRHVGWAGSLINLYRMDVSSNELPFRNVTVRWVPDLYYLPPPPTTATATFSNLSGACDANENQQERSAVRKKIDLEAEKRLVRYDWKDDMGDDLAINDTMDILQWFLSVADLTDAQLNQLLVGIQNLSETP